MIAARGGCDRAVGETRCPACGTSDARPFATVGDFAVRLCRRCGLGRTVPQPRGIALAALYAGERRRVAGRLGTVVDRTRGVFARAFAARIARRAGQGGRVLDVGCGDGKVLVALARRGYACEGVEPNLGDASPATIVHRGTLEDARLPPHAFRVVIVRHVLEHVPDPLATLREIRRVMIDDGHLFLAVPNVASWQARAAAEHWLHLDVPRHLWHFTPRSLRALLAATGFDRVRVSHWSLEHNPYGWLQSAFNALGGRWRLLYERLRATPAAPSGRVDPVVVAAATLLAPACVGLAALEALARRGGTIEIWARAR